MDLYVCYSTIGPAKHHPCAKAYRALREAGHHPKVIRTYGCYGTDRFFSGRRAIKELTGNYKVPTLVLDDGSVIDESQRIADWASQNAKIA
jgi:Glutathione S-transferase, N-terminal domain